MNKKVLIICTGNSCRSIIAEALINANLKNIEAYSCGVNPSEKINPNAQKVLESHNEWDKKYYSKDLDKLRDIEFDLIVTVCDHANENCPTFSKQVTKIHIGFEDPDGKDYEAFELTYAKIKKVLLPKVQKALIPNMQKNVFSTNNGVKINFIGAVKKQQILQMVENCATGSCSCMSDETKKKMTNMEVKGKDGNIELNLTGEISKQEIEEALSRSKVLNKQTI